jgi:hypothetical protein
MASDTKQLQLLVRREMARRQMDCSMVEITASHGVIYLRGTVRQVRGQAVDLKQELTHLCTVLKQRAGIRDVIPEVQIM